MQISEFVKNPDSPVAELAIELESNVYFNSNEISPRALAIATIDEFAVLNAHDALATLQRAVTSVS